MENENVKLQVNNWVRGGSRWRKTSFVKSSAAKPLSVVLVEGGWVGEEGGAVGAKLVLVKMASHS